MNEDEVQQRRRQQDEASTEQRSRILGLKYLDMRPIEETLPLARDLMTIEEMHNLYMLPLTDGNEQESYQFAVTTQTPQSVIQRTRRTYQDRGLPVEFYLISLSAYRVLMNRFDPPKKIVYDDIKIAKAGDSETIAEAFASRRAAYPETPDWEIEAWVSTYTAIAKGELAQVTQDLPRLIGREPLTFEQVVTELANSPAAVSAPRDSGKP